MPIAIEGMVIEPGDLVLGDDDGVRCVPHGQTGAVFEAATAKHSQEEKKMRAMLAGQDDRRWIDAALQRLGCENQLPAPA